MKLYLKINLCHTHEDGYYGKKIEKNKCWPGDGEIGTLVLFLNGAAAVDHSMAGPQKLNTERASDPAPPLLSLYAKTRQAEIRTGVCAPVFTAALFAVATR